MTNLRVSTSGLFAQGLSSMQLRQGEIAKLNQQINSGVRLTRAADDPAGMAASQRLDHLLARLEQYGSNATIADSRLRQQESALSDSGDILLRARELAVQANNDSLSDPDRRAIALELRSLRAGLLQIANRDDGAGRRLFAGTRDGVVPFTDNAGSVAYSGDDGQNVIDIGPDASVRDSNPGSEVFLRVRTGDGTSRARAAAANTGTGVLETAQVIDPAAWNGATLTLRFSGPGSYEVVDGAGNPLAPPVAGSYTPGQAIVAQGAQFQVSGTPAAGDSFTLQRAPNQDVFATLQQLADALDTPALTDADRVRRRNALTAGLKDVDQAQQHFLDLRADTGVRRNELDQAADRRLADDESFRTMLSDLRDTDLTEAISQLNLKMVALEAAQRLMVRMQAGSLFDRL
ncbi:flagellar hook-associated protein FlgL [Cognatiluteimonas weifangensis]|uniref:Flagellar hook-associated protein 3 n=1 Tax=Cognatiluteimonas weifangensis TaxID=2303539 RepID=A0A372DRF0_9GAMM|nr:flagellar hook-associated protein FlgL [Luteimonas weifangensis]RFP62064.1 flagellar hook-associated protein 3 [Luteimonas weifangensis]